VAGERQTMSFVHCCNTNSDEDTDGHADDLHCAQRCSLILLSYVVSVTAAIMSKLFFHVTITSENND